MVKAVQWLLCTYLALKLVQYFLVARPGFGNDEPRFRDKLLRGEPVVFLVACALAVPAALWSTWHFERGYQRGLERSADCYGRLRALRTLASLENEFDALRVFRSTRLARHSVSLAANSLGLTPVDADKLRADRLDFYTRRYAALSPHGDRPQMRAEAAAIESCMSAPMINF